MLQIAWQTTARAVNVSTNMKDLDPEMLCEKAPSRGLLHWPEGCVKETSVGDRVEYEEVVCADWVSVSARGDRGRGALVPALRPVLTRRGGALDRTRDRGRSRDHVPMGADLHVGFVDAARPTRNTAGKRSFVDETYVKVVGRSVSHQQRPPTRRTAQRRRRRGDWGPIRRCVLRGSARRSRSRTRSGKGETDKARAGCAEGA
jgi:hypothetical protein